MQTLPQVGPVESIRRAFATTFTFEGRSRRSEYWWFFLFQTLVSVDLLAVDSRVLHVHYGSLVGIPGVLGFGSADVWGLLTLVPNLSLAARRLHDTGRSGWSQLVNLLPLVGTIIFLAWTCQDSRREPNQWGPSPKYVGVPGPAQSLNADELPQSVFPPHRGRS